MRSGIIRIPLYVRRVWAVRFRSFCGPDRAAFGLLRPKVPGRLRCAQSLRGAGRAVGSAAPFLRGIADETAARTRVWIIRLHCPECSSWARAEPGSRPRDRFGIPATWKGRRVEVRGHPQGWVASAVEKGPERRADAQAGRGTRTPEGTEGRGHAGPPLGGKATPSREAHAASRRPDRARRPGAHRETPGGPAAAATPQSRRKPRSGGPRKGARGRAPRTATRRSRGGASPTQKRRAARAVRALKAARARRGTARSRFGEDGAGPFKPKQHEAHKTTPEHTRP